MPGILYIVATPIGNLEDISLRAVRILKEVDIIAAEDTRHTKNLLDHYGIATRLTSYHEHNEKSKARDLVKRLVAGKSVALVCDAGTPAISDPGYRVVTEAIGAGITVVPVPGASALTAVLSAAGLPTDRFVFEGFLPAKKSQRKERLEALRGETRTVIFYEAPHRLKEALQDIQEVLGDRDMVLGREVSKMHEEFLRGRISELAGGIAAHARGELTLMIGGFTGEKGPTEESLRAEIRKLKNEGWRVKEIAKLLGERYSYSKKEIYRLALQS
ncbi:MAG: 16S rRNA (cytidine(1402)-2'-O)-methyltransferase [Candidatus Binatia bacterium]